MTTSITGMLLSKRAYGDWALGDFKTHDQLLKIVGGAVTTLDPGQCYVLTGKQSTHPKHGERFEVTVAAPHIAIDPDALVHHLTRHFNGIGQKTAARIVEHYQEGDNLGELHRILVESPWELNDADFGQGNRRILYKEGDKDSARGYLYRLLSTRHLGLGVPDPVLRRLAEWLIDQFKGRDDAAARAIGWFQQDPYHPTTEVMGYGFQYADAVARSLHIAADSPVRVAALLYNTLRHATDSEGHTFLPKFDFEERVRAIDPAISFPLAATYLAQRGYPVVCDDSENFYLEHMLRLEDDVVSLLYPMLQRCTPIRPFASEASLIEDTHLVEKRAGALEPINPSQRRAVVGMLSAQQRLHTLTAGPGYGKTKLLEVFAQMVPGSVAFCTPTGKASRVLLARIHKYGLTATTIHQLLEPNQEGFQRNSDNPLEADVVVVDESSMVDLALFWSLLDALKPTAHLILTGDDEQLASVGPGNVLANIRKLDADHHTLDTTYRNKGQILALVRSVKAGKFVAPPADADDVLYVDQLDVTEQSFSYVQSEYLAAIARAGLAQTVLLTAIRKGRRDTPGWNTTYLNARLQDAVNGAGEPVRGTFFRIGDRVIIRRNMLIPDDAGAPIPVVNGDTGFIASVEYTPQNVVKRFFLVLDDGRRVGIAPDLADLLELAYALTVHASQGSEYQEVIVVVRNGGSSFMHRKVLYTAVSRARERLALFGERDVLARIAARMGGARYSALVHKLKQMSV